MSDRQTSEVSRQDEQTACQEIHAPAVRSEELLRGTRELRIIHGSEIYRLQLTRNNRLILHK